MQGLQDGPTRQGIAEPPGGMPPAEAEVASLEVFAGNMLAALTDMAVRSRHCQADVAAVRAYAAAVTGFASL